MWNKHTCIQYDFDSNSVYYLNKYCWLALNLHGQALEKPSSYQGLIRVIF